jgi:hypothetical protein
MKRARPLRPMPKPNQPERVIVRSQAKPIRLQVPPLLPRPPQLLQVRPRRLQLHRPTLRKLPRQWHRLALPRNRKQPAVRHPAHPDAPE